MMSKTMAAAVLAFSVVSAAWGDNIELSDGRKFSGSISRQGDSVIIKTDDGKSITVRPNDISKVTLTSTVTPDEAAASEWTKIAVQIKSADDLKTVIDLYKKFAEKFPNSKQAAEAKSNVDVYTKISESDGVKFRGRWMPRAQVDVTIKQWTEAAKPATDLYKAGRMKDALDAVKAVLDKDSQNPDALTVGGLAAYRAANMVQARTYFTSLAASDPGNVLAENNLGVISTLQKAAAEGLLHYAKALQIAPDNRLVLDNIAEAINSYLAGNGDKNATPYKALLRQAQAAESKLEDVMAKQGFYRWGSTWVTKEQRDKLKANSDGIKEQMMKLDSQYGAIRNSLAGLENQIKQAAADIDSYTSTVSYLQGQIMLAQQRAIDSAILIAQQNTALQNIERTTRYRNQLQQQYDQVVLSTKDFLVQADRLKNAVSSGNLAGQFTGSQRIMDLGEAEKAPEPVAVADPAPLPPLPNPPTIIMQPPVPIQPPVIVPVPVVPTVFQR